MENPSHVAVIPFPFPSHPAATLAFTQKLAAAAPNTTFSFFNTARSNNSLFTSRDSFSNIIVYDVEDGVPEDYVFTGGVPQDLIEMFEMVTPQNYKKAIKTAVYDTGKSITCMFIEPLVWQAAKMAEELNVPLVLFWTAGACHLSVVSHGNLIRETIAGLDESGREDLTLSFVPGMSSALCINDMAFQVFDDNFDSIFMRLVKGMGQAISRATTVAFNEFENLNPSIINEFRSKPNKWLAIGPLNLTTSQSPSVVVDPYGCIPWLNTKKPSSVAYISFGTMCPLPPDELTTLAEALEENEIHFIWSLKDNMKKLLPQGFLNRAKERGMVIPWAPQTQILAHECVGVFVTHCGWKSVLESVTGGVPLICRPFFGDQLLNAGYVSNVWKIGVRVKGGSLTKYGLTNAFNLVLFKEEGKRMREKAGSLQKLSMQVVGHEGSSTMNFKTLLNIITRIE